MILIGLFLFTLFALGLCMQRGIVSEATGTNAALAGGLGAGIGIAWKFVAGQDEAGFMIETAFLAAGILLTNGALHYGKRIRRLRTEAAQNPEIFE